MRLKEKKMKILKYFAILFFFLPYSAQSNEWTLVYENSFNEDKVFIDISNIEKKDNLIYFWDMLSHKEYNDTHKYWSVTAYIEANCDEFWYRKLNLLMHEKEMGTSPAFFETKNRSHIIIKPKKEKSGQFILLKTACDLSN